MSIPVYSTEGVGNRDLFLEYRNSVLFYFEDEGWEEFYARLLARMELGEHFEDVFCLGGKGEMMKRLRDEQAPPGKKRVFVFDKDFDDLLGTPIAGDEAVYLGRYSIENYFLTEDLLLEYLVENKKRLRKAECSASLNFADLLASIVTWYRKICRYFVLAQRFRLRKIRTTKMDASEFFDVAAEAVRNDWWEAYERNLLERVEADQGWILEGGLFQQFLDQAFSPAAGLEHVADGHELAHLPGKHLLAMILEVCARRFELAESGDRHFHFLMTAAQRVDLVSFSNVQARLRQALEVHRQ